MDLPADFRCPISMEIMEDPVIICTGVTYERENIERWFFEYKKETCPATMQKIVNFDVTPNHTLKRLILAWHNKQESPNQSLMTSSNHQEMVSIINTMDSSPFKVSSLKKLRSIIEMGDQEKDDFIHSNGVESVINTVIQILEDNSDFVSFSACEEALSVLVQFPLLEGDKTFELLSCPDSMKAMAIMLQRGNAECRLSTISILKRMAKAKKLNWSVVILDQGLDFLKSILELVSDEFCTKASSCALGVFIEILGSSKKSRLKAIEAGAMCVLIELLPDSSRSKCEKILLLIKLLCECTEGRLALVGHGMGIAAISKIMIHVSNTASKIGVKILWLICNSHPTEKVLEEMLVCGAVKKLLALLHLEGRSTTKDRMVKMLKMHGLSWRKYACFPSELKEYLGYS